MPLELAVGDYFLAQHDTTGLRGVGELAPFDRQRVVRGDQVIGGRGGLRLGFGRLVGVGVRHDPNLSEFTMDP
jgi:hypothetical protein